MVSGLGCGGFLGGGDRDTERRCSMTVAGLYGPFFSLTGNSARIILGGSRTFFSTTGGGLGCEGGFLGGGGIG